MSPNRTDAVTLLVLTLAYGSYALAAVAGPLNGPLAMAELIGLYLAIIVAMAAFHALVAITVALLLSLPDARVDRERERRINAFSARNGYGVLMAGLWAAPFLLLLPEGQALIIHAVVGLMGAAEIVRYASRIAGRASCQDWGRPPNRRALAN